MSISFYPKSFPTPDEERFLHLVLCHDDAFLSLWDEWRKNVSFEDIDFATLRLLPLLYLRLRHFTIQDEITGRIKGAYRLCWYKNQRLIRVTQTLIEQLQAEQIPVLCLKGLPLLETVYHDAGARFMGDADLLIEKKHVNRAASFMQRNGWEPLNPGHVHVRTFSDAHMRRFKEIAFKHKENGSEVDLHWKIFDSRQRDIHDSTTEHIWNDAIPMQIGSASCFRPCTEDLLIHIIVHGAAYNTNRPIRWITDAVHLMNSESINWEKLLERTKIYKKAVEIQTAFRYLSEKAFFNVPSSFLRSLNELPIRSSEIKHYRLLTSSTRIKSFFGDLAYIWYTYLASDQKIQNGLSPVSFLNYLYQRCNLPNKRALPLYIFRKYTSRFYSMFLKKNP